MKLKETMSIVKIDDNIPPSGRLGVAWGVGNQLVIHPRHGKAAPGGGNIAKKSGKAHEIAWETTLYEPIFRKLVNESLGVFQSLAKLSEQEKVVPLEQLVKVSRQYRKIFERFLVFFGIFTGHFHPSKSKQIINLDIVN